MNKPNGWEEKFNNEVCCTEIFDSEGGDITEKVFSFISQAILSAEERAYKKGLDDMFIEISKLAESDEKQFGIGNLNRILMIYTKLGNPSLSPIKSN